MQVTSATNAPAASAATTSVSTTASQPSTPTLGYNEFLQLLVAQMRNQDPTAPTDSTQFVAQLATFSNVEQQVQANAKLDKILGASSLEQADSLIGRTLTNADGSVSGIVVAVDTNADNPTATLDSGRTLPLQSGVRIS